jgi:hypothetical protein
MGTYAGVDYKLTLFPFKRVDSNTFALGNSVPESILTLCQSRLYSPVRDFGFGLRRQQVLASVELTQLPSPISLSA